MGQPSMEMSAIRQIGGPGALMTGFNDKIWVGERMGCALVGGCVCFGGGACGGHWCWRPTCPSCPEAIAQHQQRRCLRLGHPLVPSALHPWGGLPKGDRLHRLPLHRLHFHRLHLGVAPFRPGHCSQPRRDPCGLGRRDRPLQAPQPHGEITGRGHRHIEGDRGGGGQGMIAQVHGIRCGRLGSIPTLERSLHPVDRCSGHGPHMQGLGQVQGGGGQGRQGCQFAQPVTGIGVVASANRGG